MTPEQAANYKRIVETLESDGPQILDAALVMTIELNHHAAREALRRVVEYIEYGFVIWLVSDLTPYGVIVLEEKSGVYVLLCGELSRAAIDDFMQHATQRQWE